jgi:subtilisin family serine protease
MHPGQSNPTRHTPSVSILTILTAAALALSAAPIGVKAAGIPAPAVQATPPAAAGAAALTNRIFIPLLESGSGTQPAGGCTPTAVQDSLFPSQPNMRQIHADQAWANCQQGSPTVVVAVVDGGVDLTHPDLAANLLPGYNFVENNPVPQDDNGHGTHVAGIIAAGLNGLGVVGVAPKVSILPVRVMSDGSGSNSTIAAGIRWAADRAQIINLSLGGPSSSRVLQDAINYAIQTKGRLVIAAAGNAATTGNQTEYPAAFPGVIAVAAVDQNGQHAYFSNTGSYVALSAPGINILSTVLNGGYGLKSGTSMASPHVAGLAGLFWSRFPTDTAGQIAALMENTAVDQGDPGWDPVYGYGLIDAFPAGSLSQAQAVPPAAPTRSQALPTEDRAAPIVPERVLVKYKPGAAPTQANISAQLAGLDVQILTVPAGQEWSQVDALREDPSVEYAEPDFLSQTVQ